MQTHGSKVKSMTRSEKDEPFPVVQPNDNLKLFNGDFRIICRKEIPDNSLNLIFTDPPYGSQHLCLYEKLGTEGFRMLKGCGSLLTYAPQCAFPQIFDCMKNTGLSYWWMITAVSSGGATRMHKQKLWTGWKPILWFVKGNKLNGVNDILDIVKSQSIDEVLNIWEHPTVVSDYFIQNLTVENDTVLDPMMGSGTTGISALKLGRKFIGIDIDESNFLASQNRLQQVTLYPYHTDCSAMTEACLVDCLKQNLATIMEYIKVSGTEKIYDNRKYYNQVHNLLKIGAFKPVPHFPVSVSDLWPPLLKELRVLDKRDRNFVLKQAVGRIFEDVNSKLYHSSISRVLEVRLVD
jgi:16S rRNA G966 N2-methylase RsmD